MGCEFVLTCLVGRAFPVASIMPILSVFALVIALTPIVVAVFSLISMLRTSKNGSESPKGFMCWLLSPQTLPIPSVGDVAYRFHSVRDLVMLVCKNDAEPYKCKKWSKDLSAYTKSGLCSSLRELDGEIVNDYKAYLDARGKLSE